MSDINPGVNNDDDDEKGWKGGDVSTCGQRQSHNLPVYGLQFILQSTLLWPELGSILNAHGQQYLNIVPNLDFLFNDKIYLMIKLQFGVYVCLIMLQLQLAFWVSLLKPNLLRET